MRMFICVLCVVATNVASAQVVPQVTFALDVSGSMAHGTSGIGNCANSPYTQATHHCRRDQYRFRALQAVAERWGQLPLELVLWNDAVTERKATTLSQLLEDSLIIGQAAGGTDPFEALGEEEFKACRPIAFLTDAATEVESFGQLLSDIYDQHQHVAVYVIPHVLADDKIRNLKDATREEVTIAELDADGQNLRDWLSTAVSDCQIG